MNKKSSMVLGAIAFAVLSSYLGQNEGLNKNSETPVENFKYTKHARCRMDCRFVSEIEVRDVVSHGRLNSRKSDPRAKPCPVVVREKKTVDQQNVRVVYGECSGQKKIITVIDLDTDHTCDCR